VVAVSDLRAGIRAQLKRLVAGLETEAGDDGRVDLRWYWAAPLLLDQAHHPAAIDGWFGLEDSEAAWAEGEESTVFASHAREAWKLLCGESEPLGRQPDDLLDVLTDLAIGGPAICALRGLSAVTGLGLDDKVLLDATAKSAAGLRRFFNEPEINALILSSAREQRMGDDDERERYWLFVVRHCIEGNFQALLDEHFHILRDWLGFVDLSDQEKKSKAVHGIVDQLSDGLGLRASSFKVDVPEMAGGELDHLGERSLRTKFAVAFGQRVSQDEGIVRAESLIGAFNSPFWPFVLVSTSIGQEGLDFHLWSHAVVHWNLPSNPVDLEQREGRVHRYKGHAIRRNLAASLDESLHRDPTGDVWQGIFDWAVARRDPSETDLVPYWVYPDGPAHIERHVPLPPYSRDEALLPHLRQSLAAYRLAFGQPRQEDLIEFLSLHHDQAELATLLDEIRIDLSPPADGGI
jgi:hypothetical protein